MNICLHSHTRIEDAPHCNGPNPCNSSRWAARALAVLIKITRRWGRHGGRQGGGRKKKKCYVMHTLHRKEVWGDGEIEVLDATYQNKHVILKEDMRTCAGGETDYLWDRSKSDRKAEIERAGRRVREGQSWRHVKAEITGYPCVISVHVYLRLPCVVSFRPSSCLTK